MTYMDSKIYYYIENQSNLFSEMTNSRIYYEKKLDESNLVKGNNNSSIVYNSLHDLETRRMVLEMTKYIIII